MRTLLLGVAAAALLLAGFAGVTVADTDTADWYAFQPENTPRAGAVGLQDWLERPAGKHGRIVRRGDRLVYDGRPIRLWGINNTYANCAPDKALAEKRADFYAKFGINCVRLHKFADGTGWRGIQAPNSFVRFDAEALDRMDYYVGQLKKRGIYVTLSATFGVKLGPADHRRVPYVDEFGNMRGNRVHTGRGSIYLSRELQDLQIEQMVKLLGHRNPYTGLTYAEDPAVAVVELVNEDSALWYGVMNKLKKVPTLRQRAAESFSRWLRERYGDHDSLVKAWGQEALNSFKTEPFTGEHLSKNNIAPAGDPWSYYPEQLSGDRAHQRRRLFDTMEFLYGLQNEFYDRYMAALREAGYEGEVVASNWQAGRAYSHYLNLHSDYRVGTIDRHSYFGGDDPSASMLTVPGTGSLTSGLEQAADRPFALSEWSHIFPNEWAVEGPAILAAYGLGLQGWDAACAFQDSDDGSFSSTLGRRSWDATAPQVLGLFPAVSRQVLRGDVTPSELTATRYVHLPSLLDGRLGFDDEAVDQRQVKTFDHDAAPVQTLAVARTVVEFTNEFRKTPAVDLGPYIEDRTYVSSTGQLRWTAAPSDEAAGGYFTVDTPATQAVVGFAEGQRCELGTVTIEPQSPFGAVYVTARGRDEDLASGGELLVVALARARNTGMKTDPKAKGKDRVTEKGEAPILMEPVRARITLRREGTPTVERLDHDGLPTGHTVPVTDGAFTIDGARDETPYYLVRYGENGS